jgi:glycosyltransferase involved in cell wall biosynthesis
MSELPIPRVSVIVPVRNRREMVGRLLAALDVQNWTDFEVVVVDDGSIDGTDQVVADALVAGRQVTLVRQHGSGAVAARQRGVEVARGEILAFTDSDCMPEPGWLKAGVAEIDNGADVVDGRTIPEREVGPLERSVGQENDGLYATCNVFYRKESFVAAGGFDQEASRRLGFRFTPWAKGLGFGEDTLLGWRVARHGTPKYAPEAVVVHHVFPNAFREWLTRSWMMAAFPGLLREVPEIRPTFLRHGVMFGQRSRLPVYVCAGALITGRPKLAAAALGWWAAIRYQDVRRAPIRWPKRVALVGEEMFLDVIQASALTAGSIKARTVAL